MTPLRAAAVCLGVFACSKESPVNTRVEPPTPPLPPPSSARALEPERPAPAPVATVRDADVDAGVMPGAAVGAAGKRSSYASETIASCLSSPPPNDCASDAECAMFDIPTMDGPCPSTLQVGVRADARRAYMDRRPFKCSPPFRPALCVVHWHRAEDGPTQPPAGTTIGARCVKPRSAARGVCLTQYLKP